MSNYIRSRITRAKKLKVHELDNWECVYCGLPVSRKDNGKRPKRTIDHLSPIVDLVGMPISVINSIGNLVTSHYLCNRKLEGMPIEKKNPQFGRFRSKNDIDQQKLQC